MSDTEEIENMMARYITIAEKQPSKYQVACFQALLEDYLTRWRMRGSERKD
jgi:hypothetical protein